MEKQYNAQLPFNLKLKVYILRSGVTQEAIGCRAGIKPSAFSNIIRGKTIVSPEEKAKLANVLSCNIEDIFY